MHPPFAPACQHRRSTCREHDVNKTTKTKVHLLVEAEIEAPRNADEIALKALARNTLWQSVVANASDVDAERGIIYKNDDARITFSSPKIILGNRDSYQPPRTNPAKSIANLARRCADKIVDATYGIINRLA